MLPYVPKRYNSQKSIKPLERKEKEKSTEPWIGWMFGLTYPPLWNDAHPWMSWALILTYSNLTPDMISQYQQSSTNPWVGWALSLTGLYPGYGQSQSTELHQSMDCQDLPNLTLDMVSHNQQNSSNRLMSWAFGLT
jgi:hypothetical protein